MKQNIAIVIAALMITSMATAISTTTVATSASFGTAAATVSIAPATLGGGRYQKITLTVTNTTTDNIVRVLVRIAGFDNPLGGEENDLVSGARSPISDNWDRAADNLALAGSNMSQVTENLKAAATALKTAGTYLKQAGENLKLLGLDLQTSGRENASAAGSYLYGAGRAGDDWIKAGTLLNTEPFDLIGIKSALDNASLDMQTAAVTLMKDTEGGGSVDLREAGLWLGIADNAADAAGIAILGGRIRLGSDNFDNMWMSENIAGRYLGQYTGAGQVVIRQAGDKLENLVAPNLMNAKTYLRYASDNIRNTGNALSLIENYLNVAKTLRQNNDTTATLSYIAQTVIDNLSLARDNMVALVFTDNFLAAGLNLQSAGAALRDLSAATTKSLREFGSSNMSTGDNYVILAGDNMVSYGLLSFTTAASNLVTFGTNVSAAAALINTTEGTVSMPNWILWEPIAAGGDAMLQAAGPVGAVAFGDNTIAPGATKTLSFLWLAPTTSATYNVYMWTYRNDNTQTSYTTSSILLGATIPTLTLKVKQGTAPDNVVGTVLASGRATLTMAASTVLSSIGTVVVENAGGSQENLLPPITMTTSDSINYTGSFAVGNWDDNVVRIRVKGTAIAPSATDTYGNENTTDITLPIYVDTRVPLILGSGMSVFTNLPRMRQPGTNKWFYVDNTTTLTIAGEAEDNARSTSNPYAGSDAVRFGKDNASTSVLTITLNGVSLTPTAEENFQTVVTLTEGMNTAYTLKVVDWTGNSAENKVENVFVDTKKPTITFNTITKAGTAWTDGVVIRDNKPVIKVTMLDPGYPNTGLGVDRDNAVSVYLIKDGDNVSPYTLAWNVLLENSNAWNVATGVFENTYDNNGRGLLDGKYWVWVAAGDNLRHGLVENENAARSFVIDTMAPSVPTPTASDNPISGSSISNPAVKTSGALTISGSGAEVGATMKVFVNNATTPVITAIVDTYGRWTATLTLTPGTTTKVEVSITDAAGNESARQLYGYVLADSAAPTVTITAPVASGSTYSTDQASIVVSGSITKDAWEVYNSGAYAVTATSQVGSTTAGNLTIGSDGKYTISVALSEGVNSVTVRAIDSAGNSNSASITVTRTVTQWATYAIIVVIIALILAAIAIFRRR